MPAGYGRAGIQVGGKGGQTVSGAYDFSTKSAQSYLSGNLAGQYASDVNVLKSDVPSAGKAKHNIRAIQAKEQAKGSLGKLRELAEANAVGEFLEFAGGKGRGSQARASKGLLTPEEYAPSGIEEQISRDPAYQKRLGKRLGIGRSAGPEQLESTVRAKVSAEYGPGAAMTYQSALRGTDPRAARHYQLVQENQQLENQRYLQSITPNSPRRFNPRGFNPLGPPKPNLSQTAEERFLGM